MSMTWLNVCSPGDRARRNGAHVFSLLATGSEAGAGVTWRLTLWRSSRGIKPGTPNTFSPIEGLASSLMLAKHGIDGKNDRHCVSGQWGTGWGHGYSRSCSRGTAGNRNDHSHRLSAAQQNLRDPEI